MQNIEFKAELRDFAAARKQCEVIGARFVGTLKQTDTYFRMPDGRLKKRETEGDNTEWIFYHRPDRVRPTMSNFTILADHQAKVRWGTHSLRPWLVVKKARELWMLENVRIHLDDVEQLGRFLEFEALVSRYNDVADCRAKVAHLRETFMPWLGEPISAGYSDLMDQVLAESR